MATAKLPEKGARDKESEAGAQAIKIVVVTDTHRLLWEELSPQLRKAIAEADGAIHCGDFTGKDVVTGMQQHSRRFAGVYGNMDSGEIRHILAAKQVIEVAGKRIGILHPAYGGPPFYPEELLVEFSEKVDAIVFGHLHEVWNMVLQGVLFFSPGQGYDGWDNPATVGILTIAGGNITAEIKTVDSLPL